MSELQPSPSIERADKAPSSARQWRVRPGRGHDRPRATRPRATKFARQVPILRDFALLSSLSDCTESEKDGGFGCGVFLDGESREEF